jgi:hypothetical protein
MRLRRTVLVGLLAIGLMLPATADVAGAATGNVSGTLTGPGGFRQQGCNGIISEIGNGTYAAEGLGRGTYVFDVCITNTGPIAFDGTVTFRRRSGATVTGTIAGTLPSGGGPTFAVTVTGGTKRYARARGDLVIGPLAESAQHNCDPRVGICLDWTDTGPVTGTLRHVQNRD